LSLNRTMTLLVDPLANGIPWALVDAEAAPAASTNPTVAAMSKRPRAAVLRARSRLLNMPCPLLPLSRWSPGSLSSGSGGPYYRGR
jgi:hypothetical protein